MSELLAPILVLGLADSLNPVTIAVAVLLAAGKRPVPRLLAYTLGTGITYFLGGVVLAVGADVNVLERIVLLAIFNVAYVFPLIGITVIAAALRRRAEPVLERLRDLVARWGHRVLALLTGGSGCYLIAIGIRGLAR